MGVFVGKANISLMVQFSRSVVSDSLWPHELQHARPPCPSPTPRVHSNSHPSSWWCHSAISSCRPLLLLPPNPPSIRVFPNESTLHMSWPKYWSFSFSIIPSKEHPGLIFRMDQLDLLAVQWLETLNGWSDINMTTFLFTLTSRIYYNNTKFILSKISQCYVCHIAGKLKFYVIL